VSLGSSGSGGRRWRRPVSGQGECDIKTMPAEVASLRKKDGMAWSAEKGQASEEALRRAKVDAMTYSQVGV
jgi:hypothetical protein